MKTSLFLLGILVGTAAIATRAEATNYPWCAQYGGKAGGAENCGFVSFEQCMATIRGMGGFCNVNTQYVPASPIGPGVRASQRWKLHHHS
jgi:hypothetical protein